MIVYQATKARFLGDTDNRDIEDVIAEHAYAKKWNLVSDGSLSVMAPNSVDEVGCIHTCQGLEVDYIGVIIGPTWSPAAES